MRSARSFLSGLVVASVLIGCASSAQAETYLCDVKKAGPYGTTTKVRIVLSDTAATPAFTDRVFLAPTGREKEMLAVALSAIQSGMRLEVDVGSALKVLSGAMLVP